MDFNGKSKNSSNILEKLFVFGIFGLEDSKNVKSHSSPDEFSEDPDKITVEDLKKVSSQSTNYSKEKIVKAN